MRHDVLHRKPLKTNAFVHWHCHAARKALTTQFHMDTLPIQQPAHNLPANWCHDASNHSLMRTTISCGTTFQHESEQIMFAAIAPQKKGALIYACTQQSLCAMVREVNCCAARGEQRQGKHLIAIDFALGWKHKFPRPRYSEITNLISQSKLASASKQS